jgi:hypothetical protein
MLPSLTESVCALGKCSVLVGVDRFSNWPKSVDTLPRLGGIADANIEGIVRLKPDLVLVEKSSPLITRLQSLGIAVMAFDNLCREITVDIDRGSHLSHATLQQRCVNFDRGDPSDFQTEFLATWTEWRHSILPRIGRTLSSLVSRQGGKKRRTNVRRTTRKLHKLHKLHKIKRK